MPISLSHQLKILARNQQTQAWILTLILASSPLCSSCPSAIADQSEPKQAHKQKHAWQADLTDATRLMSLSNIDAAIVCYLNAIRFSPRHHCPEAYAGLVRCYQRKKDSDKAIEAFNHYLEQAPLAEPEVKLDLAELYILLDRLDEADKQLEEAANDQHVDSAHLHFVKGELLEFNGKFRDASAEYFDARAGGYKDGIDPALSRARVFIKLGDFGSAMLQCEQLNELASTLSTAQKEQLYSYMSTCFLVKGDDASSNRLLRKLLQENPENDDARSQLRQLQDPVGDFLDREGKPISPPAQ